MSATGGSDNQMSGGSLKIITDTQDWDNSVGLNTPGQSGDPDDPHYRDLFELWARGRYFPVAYSRAKVESVAERTTSLTPAAAIDLRRAAVDQGRTAGTGVINTPAAAAASRHRRTLRSVAQTAYPSAAPQASGVGVAARQHLPHPRVQHVEAVVVDAAGLEVGLAARRSSRTPRRRRSGRR